MIPNSATYKQALEQARKDLANAAQELAMAQEKTLEAESEIVDLRRTIAALARLCGEPEFVEEDAPGLTDAIRQVFKAHASPTNRSEANGLNARGVREKMELMGYAGRWGNLLASIHTVIKRLHQQGELEVADHSKAGDAFRWKETVIRRRSRNQPLRKPR